VSGQGSASWTGALLGPCMARNKFGDPSMLSYSMAGSMELGKVQFCVASKESQPVAIDHARLGWLTSKLFAANADFLLRPKLCLLWPPTGSCANLCSRAISWPVCAIAHKMIFLYQTDCCNRTPLMEWFYHRTKGIVSGDQSPRF